MATFIPKPKFNGVDLLTADGLRDLVGSCDGLFVGSLRGDELAAFDALCEMGLARRSYEGVGGFLGLAKVRFAGARQP